MKMPLSTAMSVTTLTWSGRDRVAIKSRQVIWPVIIGLSAIALAVLMFGNHQSPARQLFALFFLLFCPGMAVVRLVRLPDGWSELTIGVALSLALDALVSGTMIYAGAWSPTGAFVILAGVTMAGVMLQLRAAYRDWPKSGVI
jgi:hypothetical protein